MALGLAAKSRMRSDHPIDRMSCCTARGGGGTACTQTAPGRHFGCSLESGGRNSPRNLFMTSAPCFREVGPLKLKLSFPPTGLIDRTLLHVFLEPTGRSKHPVEKAYIRADRVEDFVRGQGLAEGTEYVVSSKQRGSALSSTEFDIAVGSTVRSTPPRAAGSVGRAGARGRERHGLTC